jgi:PAS domain S-box-containing protein
MQHIFAILRTRTGHDFSRYKQSTIRRRIQRRMSVSQIKRLTGYAKYLKENDDEVRALLKDLLISVTNFFRDPEAFNALKEEIKKLIKNRGSASDLRIWVAGCATGEEAYSVAIIIAECLAEIEKRFQVQLYGTDIDMDALHIARMGLYPANIAADVTPERLKRFFVREGDNSYRIKKEIREMVVFAPHNFIKDPPFSRMDLICCRNLLIYLESDVQKKMLPLLHYALKHGGILFLGPSETIGDATDLFSSPDKKWKIYQRREVMVSAERLRFPASFTPALRDTTGERIRDVGQARIPDLAEKIFLDSYAPTFAVIDEKYRLIYVRGRTGKYLEIASGQPNLSILDMAREGLRAELASAVYRATSEKKSIVHEGVRIRYNGGFQSVNLTVAPLSDLGTLGGYFIIVFQETGIMTAGEKDRPVGKSRKRAAELEEELKLTKENLQTTIEELEATNEELKSSNEELQSNNEEMQSTNEELDTSREELQSLNEELTTLNAELQDKNELLTKANDDLRNFLNRTDIAIIFLDEELRIRSFTPATSDIFNIRDIDVGRPLGEITCRLSYDEVVADAQEVLKSLHSKELEVRRKDGCWYNMRILPYLTTQKVVSGLVMSFLDIDKQKRAAADLKEVNRKMEDALQELTQSSDNLATLLETVPVGVVVIEKPDARVSLSNKEAIRICGAELYGLTLLNFSEKFKVLKPGGTPYKPKEIPVYTTLQTGNPIFNSEMIIQRNDGSRVSVLASSAPLHDKTGKSNIAVVAFRDISEYKQAEKIKDEFIGLVSHELRTPLTIVTSAVKTAKDQRLTADDRCELLNEAELGAESLDRILDNLLILARHQAGRMQLDKKPTNVSDVIDKCLVEFQRRFPTHKFIRSISPNLPSVLVDPERLEGILRNLLDNAVKYSNAERKIRIFAQAGRSDLVLGVSDKGIGISPLELGLLFEPFERLGNENKPRGIGLGLVVCKRLVEAHSGRIWAESKVGEGSTFRFTIPLRKQRGASGGK